MRQTVAPAGRLYAIGALRAGWMERRVGAPEDRRAAPGEATVRRGLLFNPRDQMAFHCETNFLN
jgi:hypothetical protein